MLSSDQISKLCWERNREQNRSLNSVADEFQGAPTS